MSDAFTLATDDQLLTAIQGREGTLLGVIAERLGSDLAQQVGERLGEVASARGALVMFLLGLLLVASGDPVGIGLACC